MILFTRVNARDFRLLFTRCVLALCFQPHALFFFSPLLARVGLLTGQLRVDLGQHVFGGPGLSGRRVRLEVAAEVEARFVEVAGAAVALAQVEEQAGRGFQLVGRFVPLDGFGVVAQVEGLLGLQRCGAGGGL